MLNIPDTLRKAAESQWDSFQKAAQADNLPGPTVGNAAQALKTAFAFSRFVSRTAVRRPAIALNLITSGDLARPYTDDDYKVKIQNHINTWPASSGQMAQKQAQPSPSMHLAEPEFQKCLRIFRYREMLRIAVRDLSGLADLNDTLCDLSTLADVCIQQALDYAYCQLCSIWGIPMDTFGGHQNLVVLGMGKLGARELNFSSDVDLIFSYPYDGTTHNGAKSTTNEDFFIRLSRKLIQMIGKATDEGFVFRVDVRLRPFGEAGPLALSFSRMEDYYQTHGRDWERYALIKARVVAGDLAAGRELLKDLKPFVFRRYLDYTTFESLRDMKQRIAVEVQSKGLQDNIKLGPGGIREIEFFGQMFQLLRGGVQPELQAKDILTILKHLVARQYIPDQTGEDLTRAYVFLRMAENRIQAYMDQQTHQLPSENETRLCLAAAMGFDDWVSFERALRHHRERVQLHFNALLESGDRQEQETFDGKTLIRELSAIWENVIETGDAQNILSRVGFNNSSKALGLISDLREDGALRAMSAMGRERLSKIMPLMIEAAGSATDPQQVLLRLLSLIKSICRRTAYLSLLCEYPAILNHLVRLFEASPWIADLLSRHPVLLDELLDPRTLYHPPQRAALEEELRARLAGSLDEDLEHQLEVMRIFKQINTFRVAASDITNILPLMKVSDHLTNIAEVALNEVVAISWHHLAAKHGVPTCKLENGRCQQGFAVIAYGKLGGLELGYGSDLDLVFLHAAAPGQTQGGPRPIDNAQFFARLGQRVLHLLSTHTPAGVLYETDMRLRPSGDSGMLVSHIEGFRDYQRHEAWTWEHQALIRARAISGDEALQSRFEQIRREILTQPRDPDKVRQQVAQMRLQLLQVRKPADIDAFDIKQDRGGIMDIEFLVQYLILVHAYHHPEITLWTDNVRQLQALSHNGVISHQTAFGLRRAYLILRAASHRLYLRGLAAQIDNERLQGLRGLVIRLWEKHFKP